MKEIIKEIARIDKELEKRDKSALSRYNKGVNDWELDGNIHVDLGK